MLILTRRPVETIVITLEDGRRVDVTVLRVIGNQVQFGINAPKSISVDREEIHLRKNRLDPSTGKIEDANGNR